MKLMKAMALVLVTCLLFAACATAQTGVNRKPVVSTQQSSQTQTSVESVMSQETSIQPIVSNSSNGSSGSSTGPTSTPSVTDSSIAFSSSMNTTSYTGSVYSEISSVLSDTVSDESDISSVVSRDLPVVSTLNPTISENSTVSETSSKIPQKDINTVPNYLKNHPVMEGTRDKFYWPFSKDSIWNMPIGSDAKLEPAGFHVEKNVSVDREYFVQTKASDPLVDVYSPTSWLQRMPGKTYQGQLKVPNDFFLADGTGENACATFIMPNGYSYYQLEPTCRTAEYPDRIVGWMHNKAAMSLYDQGIGGSHFGSGLSAIGGSIRKGELTSDEPIRHALKINVWANRYLYYSSQVPGFTWPADRCDSYANKEGHKNKYEGTNPLIVQGSLLVLPRDLEPKDIGIKTEVGKKIFYALQNYGAYISDDSAWSCYALCAEDGVDEEVQAKYGFSLIQTEAKNNRKYYYNDMMRMVQRLCVVTNNTSKSIGGGGTPCQPLAPDFAD